MALRLRTSCGTRRAGLLGTRLADNRGHCGLEHFTVLADVVGVVGGGTLPFHGYIDNKSVTSGQLRDCVSGITGSCAPQARGWRGLVTDISPALVGFKPLRTRARPQPVSIPPATLPKTLREASET